jgi:hypothetical protein
MAVSTIAGVQGGGIKLACILKEGNITVTSSTYGPDGYSDKGVTLASGLAKDDYVTLSTDSANTYAATSGLPVVIPITNGTLIVGKVISEPQWVKVPTSSQSTWSTMLSSSYYRVATVEFFGLSGVDKAVLVGADAANIVPGVAATIEIDASASVALTGGVVTLSCADVASGGAGIFSFHYVAKGTATVSILVGFVGGTVVIQS